MGNLFDKNKDNRVETMPIIDVLKRLDEFILPDDKEAAIDLLELIENKLTLSKNIGELSEQLHEFAGIPLIIDILKQLIADETAQIIGVTIFELQKSNIPIITEFILNGGLDLLEKIKKTHEKNEFLKMSVPKLLATILDIGAGVAINEIQHETVALQMCQKCQETVEKFKKMRTSVKVTKIPASHERANRVINFMISYSERLPVQISGLDAVIAFTKNSDAKANIRESRCIEIISVLLNKFQSEESIVWRCVLIATTIAPYGMDVAFDLTGAGLHELAANLYPKMAKDYRIQQQILWMLAAILDWPKSQRKVQYSKVCMRLFQSLLDEKEKMREEIIQRPTKKLYETVIPLSIRKFMRETEGEILVEANKEKSKKKHKSMFESKSKGKKEVDEPVPYYGTLFDTFTAGEPGLIDEEEDEEDQLRKLQELQMQQATNKKEELESIDWNSKLNYGQPKKKIEFKKLNMYGKNKKANAVAPAPAAAVETNAQ